MRLPLSLLALVSGLGVCALLSGCAGPADEAVIPPKIKIVDPVKANATTDPDRMNPTAKPAAEAPGKGDTLPGQAAPNSPGNEMPAGTQ